MISWTHHGESYCQFHLKFGLNILEQYQGDVSRCTWCRHWPCATCEPCCIDCDLRLLQTTLWWKCTLRLNKSICNPLPSQRLSLNDPNIILQSQKARVSLHFFHADITANNLCLHFVWARTLTFKDILDLRVCNKIEMAFHFSNFIKIIRIWSPT